MDTEEFIIEVRKWLLSRPDPEEILYYVRHLPPDRLPLVKEAAEAAVYSLWGEKYRYFSKAGARAFVAEIPEPDQYQYLHYFSAYAAPSVVATIAKEHPTVAIPADLPGVYDWAGEYMAKWDAIGYFGSSPEYIATSVYLHTFIRVNKDLAAIGAQLKEQMRMIAEWVKKPGQDQFDWKAQESFLNGLGIFPPEVSAQLATGPDKEDLLLAYDRMLRVLELLVWYGHPTLREPEAAIDRTLWESLREEGEGRMLAELEIEARPELAETADNSKSTDRQLFDYFVNLFTYDAIAKGAIKGPLLSYLQKLEPGQKAYFLDRLKLFLEQSDVIGSLFAPVDQYYVFRSLFEGMRVGQSALAITQILQELPEEERPAVDALLETVQAAYQGSI